VWQSPWQVLPILTEGGCWFGLVVNIILAFYSHSPRHGQQETTAHSHPQPESQRCFSFEGDMHKVNLTGAQGTNPSDVPSPSGQEAGVTHAIMGRGLFCWEIDFVLRALAGDRDSFWQRLFIMRECGCSIGLLILSCILQPLHKTWRG